MQAVTWNMFVWFGWFCWALPIMRKTCSGQLCVPEWGHVGQIWTKFSTWYWADSVALQMHDSEVNLSSYQPQKFWTICSIISVEFWLIHESMILHMIIWGFILMMNQIYTRKGGKWSYKEGNRQWQGSWICKSEVTLQRGVSLLEGMS